MASQLIPRLILAFFGLLVGATASAAPQPLKPGAVFYDRTPKAIPSAAYTLTVNDEPLIVEKFGDVGYARFIITGTAQVQITTLNHTIAQASISPLGLGIFAEKKKDTLSFTLTEARSLFVKIDGLEPLMIFADRPVVGAPRLGESGVMNLLNYLPAGRDPARAVTAEIQKAIDETSAGREGKGGVLYVPKGYYMAGQLQLKSNVHLYLESGALLQSQVNFNASDFPPQANRDSSFIFIGDARNVKISGRGIIDGNGYAVRSADARANIKLLRSAGACDLVIEDVYFRDSARWSLHVLDSERVTLRNFKLINDLRGGFDPTEKVHHALVTNTDGVDIDASRNVTVEGAFIYTCDDAITPKVTNYMERQGPTSGLIIRNNIFWTLKCALKVGDETIHDISDILFENNYIIRADRVIALWSGDGGRIHDIRVLNNRVEYVGGDYNERFFFFRIRIRREGASKPGVIENVLIKNFFAFGPAPQPSSFEGFDPMHKVAAVRFENIVIGGKRVREAKDIPLTVKKFVDAPKF